MERPLPELYDLETGRKLSSEEVDQYLAVPVAPDHSRPWREVQVSCPPWAHDEENCPCDEHVQ